MKITFKDVGQGDSIILEWEVDKDKKIGIIDCKRHNKTNPVINHLKNLDWQLTHIDFILISHPHLDHYSGMEELLTYCQSNHIIIKRFGHNIPNLSYFSRSNATLSQLRRKQIIKVVEKGIELIKHKGILRLSIPKKEWKIPLTPSKSIRLYCLSPTNKDISNYRSRLGKAIIKKNNARISQITNQIATILLLDINNHFILFTSDATIQAFDRLLIEAQQIKTKKLILAQIPHHGSKNNHQINFWKNLQYEINTPAVISSGKHNHHRLPDIEVIEDFTKHNYKVYATNHLHGMKEFLNKATRATNDALNMVSTIHSSNTTPGDQIFLIQNNAALYLS